MSNLVKALRRYPQSELVVHEATARIETLEAALRFIADGYDNQDINHVDYRVRVYQVARDALDKEAGQ